MTHEIKEAIQQINAEVATPYRGYSLRVRKPTPDVILELRSAGFKVRRSGPRYIWIGRGSGPWDDGVAL